MTQFTGWMFTDAKRLMVCTRCGAKAGEECRTPKGKKTSRGIPHTERTKALTEKYGLEPWTMRFGVSTAQDDR